MASPWCTVLYDRKHYKHWRPAKLVLCTCGRSSPAVSKEQGSLLWRAERASARAVSKAELDSGDKGLSTVTSSGRQQTTAVSTPNAASVVSETSRVYARSQKKAGFCPKQLSFSLCKPVHKLNCRKLAYSAEHPLLDFLRQGR